jgi:hypothetical protein
VRTNTDREGADQHSPDVRRAPKKRFRIEKLEERIAPKKGGNTNKCAPLTDLCIGDTQSGGSIY